MHVYAIIKADKIMGSTLSSVFYELHMADKLLPWRNPFIAWFWIFLPAFVGYMTMLMHYINVKPNIGTIEVNHADVMKSLFYISRHHQLSQSMEVIATQSKWSEGPLWIKDDESSSVNYLLYTDTVQNRIYKWEEGKGFFTVGRTIHTQRAGCRSNATYCEQVYEPGANGLIRVHPRLLSKPSSSIDLVVAQHGERAISLLRENGTRSLIATHYNGMRFNRCGLGPQSEML